MVAQVPELFETLTGMKVSELLGRLHQIEAAPAKPVNGVAKTPVEIPIVAADGEPGKP
jgi:hypothetical protein